MEGKDETGSVTDLDATDDVGEQVRVKMKKKPKWLRLARLE